MKTEVEDAIRAKLTALLSPSRLAIENESHLHQGHASSPGTGQSHFRVAVVSDRFEGLSRVERQRLVYRALEQELAGPLHALALTTRTPAEDRRAAAAAG